MTQQSYASGTSAAPLIGETLGAHFDRMAVKFADHEAVVSVHQGVRMTYGQLREATDTFARGLAALGVEHGDRVGIWSTNTIEWVVAQFATPKIGAILVNINPAYRSSEASYALRQSGVSVLLAQVRHKTSDYASILNEIRGSLPELRTIVLIGDEKPDVPLDGALTWSEVVAAAHRFVPEQLRERLEATQFDEAINIQYTSGTTGFPKGATLSHHNILNNGFFIGEGCRYTERDRVCIPVPFYHCFGMVLGNLACMTHGATIVIPNYSFDPQLTMEAVQKERCTSLYGVPTMFIAELALPDFKKYKVNTLRTGIMAGSPCPVEIMKRVQSELHMPEVTICYGMTETSPVSTQTAVDDPLDKRTGTVGRVHPHLEVKVVDEANRIVPAGVPGELCTRGYSVMLGYWNDDQATRGAIDASRWMHTGDLATMDDEGYVNIVGRIKDMIIRGGENVYPREVEEFLHTHPAVSEAQVIGVPSAKYGEEVMAWVRCKPGVEVTHEELTIYCTGKIATYKIPRHWKLVDAFPMTVTGKVQKFRMRETAVAELGLEAAASTQTA